MKRHRNPEVSTPVIVGVSLAAGVALAWWWANRNAATQSIAVTARQFIDPVTGATFTPTEMGPIVGGIPSLPDNPCPAGQSMQWGEGRGGQQTCRPIAYEVIARAEALNGRPLTREEQAAVLRTAGVSMPLIEPNREYLA